MSDLASGRPRLRLPAISWRHELLVAAFIGMEICWLTPWFLILVRPAWRLPPYAVALVLGGLMLAFYAWSRAAYYFQADVSQERLIALLALPLMILLSWRLFLHPEIPLLALRWVQEAGYGLISGGSGHWLVTATTLFLWGRGLALSRREFTFDGVSFSFRLGLLMLVIALPLLSYLAGRQVLAFVFPFFFFSLTAVSLTRLEEVGQLRGEIGRLFDFYWLAVLAAAILLLLGAGRLLLVAASPAGIETLRALWAPIGDWLIGAIIWLLSILLAPLEPFLAWLAAIMARGWQSLLEQGYLQPLEAIELGAEQGNEQMGGVIFDMALNIVRYVCAAGILLVLLVAGWWALNEERKRQREQAETHEDLEIGLRDALAGLLRNARDRLRAAAGLLGQFGLGSDLLAAISVRNIYANMSRLAAKRGFPRDKARTPYEYLPDLLAAFPQATAEAQAITDAYVAVHYGELPASRAELDALRAAYERLRAGPAAEVR